MSARLVSVCCEAPPTDEITDGAGRCSCCKEGATFEPDTWTEWVHTPSPWEAHGLDNDVYFPHVHLGPELSYHDGRGHFRARITINEGPSREDVAAGKGMGTAIETVRANARLIAAAPDLLAACEVIERLVLEALLPGSVYISIAEGKAIVVAIAKARGL